MSESRSREWHHPNSRVAHFTHLAFHRRRRHVAGWRRFDVQPDLTGLSPTVLAAQLTLDHVKCFAVHDAKTPVDARASEQRFAREYGWAIQLPPVAAAGLQLVGVRRCYCGDGPAAHAMYRLNGRPISLYMLRDVSRIRASTDVFGHDARIWSNNGRTYVLLGREPEAVMDQLANTINKALSN
jgi:hypothetical protein